MNKYTSGPSRCRTGFVIRSLTEASVGKEEVEYEDEYECEDEMTPLHFGLGPLVSDCHRPACDMDVYITGTVFFQIPESLTLSALCCLLCKGRLCAHTPPSEDLAWC